MDGARVMCTKSLHTCELENCGKQFKRRDRLLIHQRTHSGERPFICGESGCGKSYCRQSHLLRHQQNTHRLTSVQGRVYFQCQEEGCCSVFTLHHNLQKHFHRQHSASAVYTYKCDVEGCEQTFRKHHQLRTHSFVHTNVDPYKCSHPGCLRTFQTSTRLRRHLKVHQGYGCDVEGCGLSFARWTELRYHKSKVHVEEHKCSMCSKIFPKKHLLTSHHRSHHEKRLPLPCPYPDCDRMYWDRRNLKAHIHAFHEKQRFPCTVQSCGKTFASKQKLKAHAAVHDPSRPLPEPKCWNQKVKKAGRKKKNAITRITGIHSVQVMDTFDPVSLDEKKDVTLVGTQEKSGQVDNRLGTGTSLTHSDDPFKDSSSACSGFTRDILHTAD